MAQWHFGATQLDRRVARAVARNASPAVERPARLLTWAADEHLLYVVAGGLRLAARAGDARERSQTDHLALSVVATAILPHLLKRLVDQERPDRSMVHGRRRGIPRSGKAYDAFPSGHAMHVGAVASAVSWAYPKSAPVAWDWRPYCSNQDRPAGALDDRRARGPGDGCPGGALPAAAVRTREPGGHGGAPPDRGARTAAANPSQPGLPWGGHDPDRRCAGYGPAAVDVQAYEDPRCWVILGALLVVWLLAGH